MTMPLKNAIFRLIQRYGWVTLALITAGISATSYLESEILAKAQARQLENTRLAANRFRANLESLIAFDIQTARGLVAAIRVEPEMDQTRFERYAQALTQGQSRLINVGAAPNMVISMVHPYEANKSIIGLDYAKELDQKDAAERARRFNQLVIAGPITLKQGGLGIIGRIPVMVPSDQPGQPDRFWGLVSTVIDATKLYQDSGITKEKAYDLAIRGKNALGAKGEVFYGSKELFNSKAIFLSVNLPNGSWQLAVQPHEGWLSKSPNPWPLRLIMLCVTLIFALPSYLAAKVFHSRHVQKLHLQALFDQSPLGIALIEEGSRQFLEVNNILCKYLGRTKAELRATPLDKLLNKDDKQAFLSTVAGLTLRQPCFEAFEASFVHARGNFLPTRITGVKIQSEDNVDFIWLFIEDLYHRNKVEKAYLESQKQLEVILEATSLGIWDWNVQSDTAVFNERWASIIGYTKSELEPISINTWVKHTHPDDIKVAQSIMQAHWRGELNRYISEFRMRHKDGHWVWLQDTGKVIEWTDEGKPLRMVGTHQDITDKKASQIELDRSRKELENFFELSPNIMVIANSDGYFEKINPCFAQMLGYKTEELINNPFISFVHPDDVDNTLNEVDKLSMGFTTIAFKNRYRKYNGEYLSLLWYTTPDPATHKLYATAADITQQEKYEFQLKNQKNMLEAMSQQGKIGAWEYDIDTREFVWSKMARDVFDLAEDFQITLNNILPFFNGDGTQQTLQQIFTSAQKQPGILYEEFEITTAKGSPLWISATIQGEFENNKCVRLFGSFQNIHARKSATDALEAALDAANAAATAKSEFLAIMSHEIRTPMNGVLGMLNLLNRSKLDTEQQRKIHIAKSSADSLLTLINDILDFSKVDAGKLEFEDSDFNIRDMLDDFIYTMALKAQEKGLNLLLDASAVEQTHVRADPGRVRQILTNLVSNAIKFTHEGTVLVECKLHQVNDHYEFECNVKDTGIGIPEAKIAGLFEPFTQVDASTTRQYGGTGLGLAICKRLCEQMNGAISATSELGAGSSFNIKLTFTPSAKATLIKAPEVLLKTRFILVDEQIVELQNLKKQLDHWHCTNLVVPAQNIKNIQPEAADCIVVDNNLSEHSSAGETLKTWLAQYANNKIILLENIADPNNSRPIFESALIISKPIIFKDFTLISQYLANELQSEQATNEQFTQAQNQSSENNTQIRVLLVEDNRVNQEVCAMMLEDMDLIVDVAANGIEAITAIKNTDPNDAYALVLMDCQMPEMDGYEATRRIRRGDAGQTQQAIPIIALTANAMKGDEDKCLAAGMDDYLSKPIAPEALEEKIRHWLSRPNAIVNAPKG